MKPKGPRRIEIERRLALFHANRPKVIARELGVSVAWICEVSKAVRDDMARKRADDANSTRKIGRKGRNTYV